MDKDNNKLFDYEITTDPEFMDEQDAITPELSRKMELLFDEITERKIGKKTVRKLLNLIEEHPRTPQLKNYLSVVYMKLGNREKSREVNRWILAEHPDYLYGKLSRVADYFEDGEYERIPEILGELMEIQGLYPDRDVFHLSEVTSFYKMAVFYFAVIGDLEAAGSRLEIMQEAAPGHPDIDFAEFVIMKARMEENLEFWEEEEKLKIHVTPAPDTRPPQITEVPEIFNPLVIHLYENGLYIDERLINEILKLPRKSLIADLELILNDLLCRYDFFRDDVELLGWEEDEMSFPVHAIMLLGELRAEESLPKVLEVLRQDEEFLNFWFDDHLINTLWEPLYYLGNNQLDVLKKFVQEPGVETYAKTTVSTAVSQIPYHQPERNEEVMQWFAEVFDFFANSRPEDNVIDSDTIGLLICDAIDLRYEMLLPRIKTLFDKQFHFESITGDYQSVETDMKKPAQDDVKKDLLSIVNRYQQITTTWAGYKDEEDEFEDLANDDYEDLPVAEPVRKELKTGRNEPCPCGSGKKFKKCCLNKTT